jgi:hypothetical protein
MTHISELTAAERELLFALAKMCGQYLSSPHDPGVLDHGCMSAGETAVELLVRYGLVEPGGRGGTWKASGDEAWCRTCGRALNTPNDPLSNERNRLRNRTTGGWSWECLGCATKEAADRGWE